MAEMLRYAQHDMLTNILPERTHIRGRYTLLEAKPHLVQQAWMARKLFVFISDSK